MDKLSYYTAQVMSSMSPENVHKLMRLQLPNWWRYLSMALDPRPRLFTRLFTIGHKGIRAVNEEDCMFYTGFYKGLVTGVLF